MLLGNKHLNPEKIEFFLLLLILQALLLRVSIPFAVNPIYFLVTDPIRHFRYATEPLFLSPMAAMDAPFYQLWLTAVNKLTSGDPYLLAAHSAILSLLTPWLWYMFLKEATADRKIALAGFALIAWLPSWMGIFSYFMPETILLPLLGLSLWVTHKAMKDWSYEKTGLAWFFWMLTCLTKVVAVPAALVAGLWMIFKRPGSKGGVASLLVAISVVALAPMAYLNYKVLNIASPFGFPGMNQIYFQSGKKSIKANFTKDQGALSWSYSFQSPSVESKPLAPLSDWTTARSWTKELEITVDLDNGYKGWLSELQKNSCDLKTHLRLVFENAVVIIFDRSWPDETSRPFLFIPHDWLRFLWAPLLVLVMSANLFVFQRDKRLELLPVLVTVTVLFFFLLPAAVGEGRYRKPLEGLLIANALWLVARTRKKNLGKSNTVCDGQIELSTTVLSTNGIVEKR